jgi:hypothetical protein
MRHKAKPGPDRRVEPWFAVKQRAMAQRRTPQVYVLLSWNEAEALALGSVPRGVTRQVRRLLTWESTHNDLRHQYHGPGRAVPRRD